MNEQSIVQSTVQQIFEMNGYRDATLMTQRNFEQISDEIEKKSGIYISGTTIKRLSKGAFNRLPQIATLHALANYFNFNSWPEYKAAFIQKHSEVTETVEVQETAKPRTVGFTSRQWRKSAVLKWVPLLIILLCICGYYLYPPRNRAGNFEKATFAARKTTQNDLPNSVVFDYNIDDVVADSFFIQQSWDRNRRVRIYQNKHTLTDIYYEPGYHIAKLIANDSIIKTAVVNIPTDRWFFYVNQNKRAYGTEYIQTANAFKLGSLAISKEELEKSKISIDQEKIFLYSYFPSKHEVNSDNFTLKARVRMKEIRNNLCPYISIEVYGEHDVILVKSTPKGCANRAALRFGPRDFKGEETDLAPIAYDVTQWTDVELTVVNKQASIKIAGRQVFATTYQHSLKLITGLSFISNGLCEVDHVTLVGADGKIFCKESFDN